MALEEDGPDDVIGTGTGSTIGSDSGGIGSDSGAAAEEDTRTGDAIALYQLIVLQYRSYYICSTVMRLTRWSFVLVDLVSS